MNTRAGWWLLVGFAFLGSACGARSHPGEDDGGYDGDTWFVPDGGPLVDGGGRPDARPDGARPDAGPDGTRPDAGPDARPDGPPPPFEEVRCELLDPAVLVPLPAGSRPTGLVGSPLGETALIAYGWEASSGRLRAFAQQVGSDGRPRGRRFELGALVPVAMATTTDLGGEGVAAHVLLAERPDGRYTGLLLSPRGALLDDPGEPFPLDNVDPPVVGLRGAELTVVWNRGDSVGAYVANFATGAEGTFTLPTGAAPGRPSVRPAGRRGFEIVVGVADRAVRARLDVERGFRVMERTETGGQVAAALAGPDARWRAVALADSPPDAFVLGIASSGERSFVEVPGRRIPPEAFAAGTQGAGDLLAAFAGPDTGLWAAFLHLGERTRTGRPMPLDLALEAAGAALGPLVVRDYTPGPPTFGYSYRVFAFERHADGPPTVSSRRVLCPTRP